MSSVIKIDLKKPIKLDEKDINKVNLDLDKINGGALIEASKSMGSPRFTSISSMESLTYLAAIGADMIPEDLQKLSGPDLLEVTAVVNHFLMDTLEATKYWEQLQKS